MIKTLAAAAAVSALAVIGIGVLLGEVLMAPWLIGL